MLRNRVIYAAFAYIALSMHAAAANDHATCLERDGERSIAACTRVIEAGRLAGKDLATIYVLRATMYRSTGKYDLAIDDLTRAIDLLKSAAPSDIVASAFVTRGSVDALKGDMAKAVADYHQALALDSTNVQAAAGLKDTERALTETEPRPNNTFGGSAAPNEPLPLDIPVSAEVLHLVETHPFFANAPPVRVAADTVTMSMDLTISGIAGTTSSRGEQHTTIQWLRQGIVKSDESTHDIMTTQGQTIESSHQTVRVMAANGLLELGSRNISRTTSHNRVATGTGPSIAVRVSNLSGHVFPMEVGNRFSYQTVSQSIVEAPGIHSNNELIENEKCEVARKLDAKSFQERLTGAAYVVRCDFQYVYPKMKSANNDGHRNTICFDALGVWIAADPVTPREHITFDGETTKAGKSTVRTTGAYTLKSFSTVH